MARKGKGGAMGTGRRRRFAKTASLTLDVLIEGYLEDYEVRRFRSLNTARGRVAHLRAFFGGDESSPFLVETPHGS